MQTGTGKASWLNGRKKLNNDFIKHKGDKFDLTALYLFELQWSDDLNATGDMPRSKQFGYLFTEAALQLGEKAIYRTIAHELAHRVFHPKHTLQTKLEKYYPLK